MMGWKHQVGLVAAKVVVPVLALWILAGSAQAATVLLDKQHQGQGNKGMSFRPIDELGAPAIFELTARSLVDPAWPFDPDAASLDSGPGTIYIKDGAGVQNNSLGGSQGISGGGPDQNEELIFTFDNSISISEIVLGLHGIDFGSGPDNKDDPVIFLSSAANPGNFEYTVQEAEIAENFAPTGKHEGLVDFSGFSTPPPGLLIDSFKVRETKSHTVVNSLVPEPATLSSLAFGGLLVARRRR